MDANFGLVRKKHGGQSLAPPNHDGLYFIQQDVVDSKLESLPSGTATEATYVGLLLTI